MTIISFNNEINENANTYAEVEQNVLICDKAMKEAVNDEAYEEAIKAREFWNDKLIEVKAETIAKFQELLPHCEIVEVDEVFDTADDFFNLCVPVAELRKAFQLQGKANIVREYFQKGFRVGNRAYYFSQSPKGGITFLNEFTAHSSLDNAGWYRVSFTPDINLLMISRGGQAIAKTKSNREILDKQGACLTSVYTSFHKIG